MLQNSVTRNFVLVWLLSLVAMTTVHRDVPPVQAQPITPEQALTRLFTEQAPAAEWFTPGFLAQVPVAQVQSIRDQLLATLGRFLNVEATGDEYVTRFERGTVPTLIALDDQGRISGLFFRPPQFTDTASAYRDAVAALTALPGRTALLVQRDGVEVTAAGADTALAVGSAFKLAVLAALHEEIAGGRRSWDEVVSLRPEWRSLPTGILQDWPAGSPVTLHTLAALMISISDNTATDTLIHTLGRETVERFTGANRPLLTTRDLFALKAPANADLRERYGRGDEAERRALLPELAARPLPSVAVIEAAPPTPEAEWFFSSRDLCRMIDAVAALPVMQINPGVARGTDWAAVAFKGGSDTGVLNLTHALTGKDGTRWCVAATWNAESIDEMQFVGLVQTLIGTLR